METIMLEPALYVLATPIGHLDDISIRAVSVLKNVDWIVAEDTRRANLLLNHYGIKNRVITYHDYSNDKQVQYILSCLQNGSVALISDAGTPLIADPGYQLIKSVLDKNIKVIPIPGVSAMVAAVSVSGLPTDSFIFEGF